MAENTKIEWAHHTFNPWYGCQAVGPGCDNCYAESWAKRSGLVQWGLGAERRRSSNANWAKPLRWNAEAERLGIRYRVFCASLADVFDNAVPSEWRSDLAKLISDTPSLDWLLVTKRIGNVMRMVENCHMSSELKERVWLGISICTQDEADRDVPKLLAVPAKVHWLSIEPLLGPISLRFPTGLTGGVIDWVVVGGESGPWARPMHPKWVRSLRDQCNRAGVPFLFKQHGEWIGMPDFYNLPGGLGAYDHCRYDAMHGAVRVGKKVSGRLLDGVLHDQYPAI